MPGGPVLPRRMRLCTPHRRGGGGTKARPSCCPRPLCGPRAPLRLALQEHPTPDPPRPGSAARARGRQMSMFSERLSPAAALWRPSASEGADQAELSPMSQFRLVASKAPKGAGGPPGPLPVPVPRSKTQPFAVNRDRPGRAARSLPWIAAPLLTAEPPGPAQAADPLPRDAATAPGATRPARGSLPPRSHTHTAFAGPSRGSLPPRADTRTVPERLSSPPLAPPPQPRGALVPQALAHPLRPGLPHGVLPPRRRQTQPAPAQGRAGAPRRQTPPAAPSPHAVDGGWGVTDGGWGVTDGAWQEPPAWPIVGGGLLPAPSGARAWGAGAVPEPGSPLSHGPGTGSGTPDAATGAGAHAPHPSGGGGASASNSDEAGWAAGGGRW